MTVKITKDQITVREDLNRLNRAPSVAGERLMQAPTPQDQFSLIGAGRKNYIINGDFNIWQRATSVGAGSGNGYHTADRWYQYTNNTNSWAQSTDVPANQGFNYSMKAHSFSGTMILDQYVELPVAGNPWVFGPGSTFTLSYWVRATGYKKNLVNRLVFRQNGGSSTNEVSPDNAYDHKKAFPVNSTWTRHSQTFTMPHDLSLGSGIKALGLSIRTSDGDGATIAPESTDVIYITGVQLELGSVMTPFEHLSPGESLKLCQRYFQKETNDDWSGTGDHALMNGVCWSSGYVYGHYKYPSGTMRENPTITLSSAGTWICLSASLSGAASAAQVMGVNPNRAELRFQNSSMTNGNSAWVRFSTNAVITLDAEV